MFILNWLGGLLMIFAVLFVISFVVVLSLVKFGSKTVMKFLGADFFTFNLAKRIRIVALIAAGLAFVITVLYAIFG